MTFNFERDGLIDVARGARYIANQEEHNRKRTYAEEYELFVKRYGLEWRF